MDFMTGLEISASGLRANRLRLEVIAGNLANVNATRTPEGGPFRRRDVMIGALPMPLPVGASAFDRAMQGALHRVGVLEIVQDSREFKQVFEPGHPDADPAGYVAYPNINTMEEMINMLQASRSYEANISAINMWKSMALKALEIGR